MSVVTKLAAQQTLNGVSNTHTLHLEGTHAMDLDRVIDILMKLREEGAARDVKLDVMATGLKEISARAAFVDAALEEFRRRDSDFGRRLDALDKANLAAIAARVETLEKSGFRGWLEGGTAKRLGTLAALVVGVAAAIVVILQMLSWMKVHLHF